MAQEQQRNGINYAFVKPLTYTAGVLGLIQGLTWFVLSILSVLCYFGSIQIDNTTNNTEYYKLIYVIFLNRDTPLLKITGDIIVKPDDCVIFLWFYVIFSAIWICASGSLIWAMIHNQWHLGKNLFGAWSTTTIFISTVDIVFTGLLAADYATVNNNANSTEILVTYGIVMSLAARGYILWIINVIIAIIMLKITIDIVLNENNGTTMPFIHGYESGDVNPPWFNGSVKDFWASPPNNTNQTSNGYDNQGFRRSQSFSPMSMTNENIYSTPPTDTYIKPVDNTDYKKATPSNNIYYSSPPSELYKTPANKNKNYGNATSSNNRPMSFSEEIAYKTATIGKNKGRRSPLNHVSPPIIPDPDYTPPNSPLGLKSVLRSKSNYQQQ